MTEIFIELLQIFRLIVSKMEAVSQLKKLLCGQHYKNHKDIIHIGFRYLSFSQSHSHC